MTAITHQRAGLLSGLLTHHLFILPFYSDINFYSKLFMITLFCVSTTIGSLLPDIDMADSQIGSFFPFFSRTIAKKFKHRTITHSFFSLLFFILLLALAPRLDVGSDFYTIIILGLMVGHISHILLDILTPQGICLFYPIKKKISLGKLRTGAFGESLLNRILLLLTTLYFVYIIYQFLLT